MTVEIKWETPVNGTRVGRVILEGKQVGWIEEKYEEQT